MATPRSTETGMWQHPEHIADWLRQHGRDLLEPLSISRVGFGQSNITTLVRDSDGREWVLREPPPGVSAENSHDVEREAGILQRIAAADIPVPTVIGTGRAPSGAPFMMMDRVAGAALESEDDATSVPAASRYALGISVAETLGRLHRVDPAVVGIRTSSSPYVTRQIRRITESWAAHGAASPHDDSWQRLRTALVNDQPSPPTPVIMHGDFRLSNLLVANGRITAVLDWELCTIGDPMADLAWLLDDWRAPDEPRIVMPSPTRAGGFPDRDELVAAYRDVTKFDVSDVDYYRAFSQWRAASLLQGVLTRRRAGVMGSHGAVEPTALEDSIGTLLSSAQRHLASTR